MSDQRLKGLPHCEKVVDQIMTNFRQLFRHPSGRAKLLRCIAESCFVDVRDWLQAHFPAIHMSKAGAEPATTCEGWVADPIGYWDYCEEA